MMPKPQNNSQEPMQDARRHVMAACSLATRGELQALLAALPDEPKARDLRPPQVGLVMLRGRMGGDGRRFNVGEATVARATVQLENGTVGFAYQLGRDLAKARAAAIIDALWQQSETRPAIEAGLKPIRHRLDEADAQDRRRTAATRVNFFTMVRGDN